MLQASCWAASLWLSWCARRQARSWFESLGFPIGNGFAFAFDPGIPFLHAEPFRMAPSAPAAARTFDEPGNRLIVH